MYRSIFIILVIDFCFLRPQLHNGHLKKINDTVFISKGIISKYCHAVYIEPNHQSKKYETVLDFKMDCNENEEYLENYRALKKRIKYPLKTYNLINLPKEWVPLYRYKSKYYTYYPSDPGNLGRRILTDSTMIYWYMDGPSLKPFRTVKQINGCTWYFKIHPTRLDNNDAELIIHVIGSKNKIAVWENTSAPAAYRYELYVPRENAGNFDMIVNECKQNKEPEFLFDEIDFAALLKGN